MTTDEQPRAGFTHPDQAGTWEPDWRLLKQTRDKAITNIPYANDDQFNEQAYSAIVREYRRQQAERGIVEINWELVRDFIGNVLIACPPNAQAVRDVVQRYERILAAATGQDE
jgi:hypothetical protein